jgi:Ca-activated chloride channel family protein
MNLFNLMALSFAHPLFLLLLLLIPLLGWWHRRQKSPPAALRMSSLAGIRGERSWRQRLYAWLPWLQLLTFICLIVALARPRLDLREEVVNGEGIDIIMSIDLSSSMLARDFTPNRLEVAKALAADFVRKRRQDRLGLVVFAGEAFTQCPLTTDHNILTNYLSGLSCGDLKDGTAIGTGLATAVNRLKESKAKSKVIILLTDGVNNAGYHQPEVAAQLAKTLGIRVYTIGIGATGEAMVPLDRTLDGQYLFGMAQVEIDEELLRLIASMTQGRYYRATSAAALAEIYAAIDQLEKSSFELTVVKRFEELYRGFVYAAVSLLLIVLLLRYGVIRVLS